LRWDGGNRTIANLTEARERGEEKIKGKYLLNYEVEKNCKRIFGQTLCKYL
jgi:hypothetical protein